jgi:hypothetical protein
LSRGFVLLVLLAAPVHADDELPALLLRRAVKLVSEGNCEAAQKDLYEYESGAGNFDTSTVERLRNKCFDPSVAGNPLKRLAHFLVGTWDVLGRRAANKPGRLDAPFHETLTCSMEGTKIICAETPTLTTIQDANRLTISLDESAQGLTLRFSRDEPGTIYQGTLLETTLTATYKSATGTTERRISWQFPYRQELDAAVLLSRNGGPFLTVEKAALRRLDSPSEEEDRKWHRIGTEKCKAKHRDGALDAATRLDQEGRTHLAARCYTYGVVLPVELDELARLNLAIDAAEWDHLKRTGELTDACMNAKPDASLLARYEELNRWDRSKVRSLCRHYGISLPAE